MSRTAVTISQLKAFIAIVEHGSFRAAARELRIVQSGLTQQIKKLESELDAPLFSRGSSGISLTKHGEVLLARSRLVIAELERLEQDFSLLKGEHRGTISVGILSEAFLRLVPQALRELQTQFPHVNVHILGGNSSGLLQAINEGRIDFAVAQFAENTGFYADLAVTPLIKSRPGVLCRKGHPLERATSIRQLANAQWVKPRGERGSPSNRLYDWFEHHGVSPPHVSVTVESLFDTLNLICHSDYMLLGPVHAVAEGGYSDRICVIPIQEAVPEVNICLISRASAPLGPAARLFASMLVSYARMLE